MQYFNKTILFPFVGEPSITLTYNTKDKIIFCEVTNLPDPTELHFLCKTADSITTKYDVDQESYNDSVIKCSLKVQISGEYTFVAGNKHTTVSKGVLVQVASGIYMYLFQY